MNNTVTHTPAERQEKLNSIKEILSRDIIFIPKTVLTREDVYDESKLMFSVLFTECLQSMPADSSLLISKAMKDKLYATPDWKIQLATVCSDSKIDKIRSEVLRLINHTNISECISEKGAK